MKIIKALWLAVISLLFLSLPAWGENWVETTVTRGPQTFYDSDSPYIDNATRLAIIKQAAWADDYNEYLYTLHAYDCAAWKVYIIGIIEPEGWFYDRSGEMGVRTIANPATPEGQVARWLCDNYNNHPPGNIPFDFKFSNY